MISLSAFVICYNERERIPLTIRSLKKVSDDIVVVDSGSIDGTIEYLESEGITSIHRQWEGYVSQKIFAQSLCKNDWILSLDADEELSDDLIYEITSFLNSTPSPCAYKINKVFVDPQKNVLNRFNPKMQFILLYHKSVAGYKPDSLYKDSIELFAKDQKPLKFKHPIWHRSKISFKQLIAKINDYTDLQAKEMFSKNCFVSPLRSFVEMPLIFLKYYLLRRYFMLGKAGFYDSIFWTFARFIKQAKAWELKSKRLPHKDC